MAFHTSNIKKSKIKFDIKMNLFSSLSIPYMVMLIFLVLLPFFFIIFYAITKTTDSKIYLTIDNFVRFCQDQGFLKSLGFSVYLATLTTLFCVLVGYPVAYFMSRCSSKLRNALIFLITAPMWINMLLRVLAWEQILSSDGPIAWFLSLFGVKDFNFIGTDGAVIMGMVYVFLPFMIIPIYTSLSKIDKSFEDASKDLGASKVTTFCKIVLPLSMSGVISGVTMVFLPAATSIVIPKYLGGTPKYTLIGNLIEKYFINANDYNFGSSIAIIIAALILIMMFVVNKLDRTMVKDKYIVEVSMKGVTNEK